MFPLERSFLSSEMCVPFLGCCQFICIYKWRVLGCPEDLPPGQRKPCKYCEVLYLRTKGEEYAPSLLQGVSDEAAKRASQCCWKGGALESEITYNRPKKKPQKAPNGCGWGTVYGDKGGRQGLPTYDVPGKQVKTNHIAYCKLMGRINFIHVVAALHRRRRVYRFSTV